MGLIKFTCEVNLVGITMQEITARLEDFSPKLSMGEGVPSEINSIRFLNGPNDSYPADILFIARTDDICADMELAAKNVLFLGWACLPEAIDMRQVNAIIMPDCQDKMIFNTLQKILEDSRFLANHALALLQEIENGNGIDGIVDLGARVLQRQVILVDSGFKIVAYSSQMPIDGPILNRFIEIGYVPTEFVIALKDRGIIARAASSNRPFIVNSWFYEDMERIVCKVEADGKMLAYIMILVDERPFTERDLDFAELLSKLIAAEMRRASARGTTQSLMHENLLMDILSGGINREEVAVERARNADFKPGKNICVLSIDIIKHQSNSYMIDYFRQTLERWFIGSKTLLYKQHLVMVMDLKDKAAIQGSTYKRLHELMQNNNLIAAYSRTFSNLAALREHYEQSAKALEVIGLMGLPGCLFAYDELKVYHMLYLVSEYVNLIDFCHPPVLQLVNYDKKHNSNYLQTLLTYLDCQQNAVEAASKLIIHRNTLSYRLNKIAEISGMNIVDSDTVFQVQLSRFILRFMQQLNGEAGI